MLIHFICPYKGISLPRIPCWSCRIHFPELIRRHIFPFVASCAFWDFLFSISVPPRSLAPTMRADWASSVPIFTQLAWMFLIYGYKSTLASAWNFRSSNPLKYDFLPPACYLMA